MHQVSFAAYAQRLVCPPPPASANGSVPSLAAPAEPGVGVDTSAGFLRYVCASALLRRRADPWDWRAHRISHATFSRAARRVIAWGCSS
jgi:hypothetical protein